jgi:plastocyanin
MKRFTVPIVLVLALAGAAIALVAKASAPPRPARTVALRMYDYTFNGNNPTLEFRPGERVRFVVSNDEDSQVLHNFRIVGLGVPCERALKPGERREVTVTLPKSGEFAYTCCTHPGMGGTLVIRDR